MAYAARQKGVPPRAYLWQGAWVLHKPPQPPQHDWALQTQLQRAQARGPPEL